MKPDNLGHAARQFKAGFLWSCPSVHSAPCAAWRIPRRAQTNSLNMKDHLTKDQFVAVLDAAGISAAQRDALHREFERQQPAAHERFLSWLGIPAAEAARIRAHARATN